MSDNGGTASFYPSLTDAACVKFLGKDKIAATHDLGCGDFEIRHFIDAAYLLSLDGGKELLESSLIEPTPACTKVGGTGKEGGENVMGMLSQRLKVPFYNFTTQSWVLLKLQNVLVVDDLPVPFHISLKSLFDWTNVDENGNPSLKDKTNPYDFIRRCPWRSPGFFPARYYRHSYWNPPTRAIHVGNIDHQMTSNIRNSKTGTPDEAKLTAVCGGCGARGAKRHCSRCAKVDYCTRECQLAHWKIHKTMCQAMN